MRKLVSKGPATPSPLTPAAYCAASPGGAAELQQGPPGPDAGEGAGHQDGLPTGGGGDGARRQTDSVCGAEEGAQVEGRGLHG